jgi:dolichol-phosphate mannosyltransferase
LDNALYFLIPAFNEAANVGRLLDSIADRAADFGPLAGCSALHVFLVDDGSTDGTAEAAAGHPTPVGVTVLRHAANRGPGAAFATAFAALNPRLREGDRVFTLEGDNTSRLDCARRMLVRLKEGYDAVLASPFAYGGGFQETTFFRLVLSHGANGFLKAGLGIRGIHTMSSFFRVYTGGLLLRLGKSFGPGIVERAGFECMAEMLLKMTALGARVSEVEMLLDSSLRLGKSKMKILRTIRGYLALLRLRSKWVRELPVRGGEGVRVAP